MKKELSNNLDRSTVRTSDFKSENLGSIPSQGAFFITLLSLLNIF